MPGWPTGYARHAGEAELGAHCADCPLAAQCTRTNNGRSITIGHHEARLATARIRQTDRAWKANYRATRPEVERKIGRLMFCRHGGRRARMRGQLRVAAEFALLAAATNVPGSPSSASPTGRGWTLNPA